MSFSLFRLLPPELRREIWETALEFSSPDREVCVFSRAEPQADGTLLKPLEVHRAYSPLLAACGESRDVVLGSSPSLGRGRPFDPASDVLFVGADVFSVFIGRLCFPGSEIPGWVGELRHLALDLRVARAGLWLPLSLENMPRLETVSVVFPQARGAMDVHASAEVPDRGRGHGHVETRVLAAEETDAMVIEADYLFETYMGEHPVQWKKSATEYMQEVVSGLRRDVSINADSLPPCWDKESKQLRLKFEARCFV